MYSYLRIYIHVVNADPEDGDLGKVYEYVCIYIYVYLYASKDINIRIFLRSYL
jgi:hypothetical protein